MILIMLCVLDSIMHLDEWAGDTPGNHWVRVELRGRRDSDWSIQGRVPSSPHQDTQGDS